ncbi:hypothetical protein UPYG_G00302620 [Umbra pygmaea]|uniref:Uncharacterized protein n=1 Tax=Umbra pygmaea TaxID=75934 RepID=A0ABD0W863_UMBPY
MESTCENQFQLITIDKDEEVGDDVILRCHLSSETSAVTMTIRWFRYTECIYVYENGQVTERRGYEGRLSLITQELERGNVSLRMKNIKKSDRGVYICQVINGEHEEKVALKIRYTKGPRHLQPEVNYLEQDTHDKKKQREASASKLELNFKREASRHAAKKEKMKIDDKEVEEMKRKLREYEEKIKEKESTLEEKNKELIEKDSILEEKNKELMEKDSILEEKNKELMEKDSILEEKNKELMEKEKQLKETDQQEKEICYNLTCNFARSLKLVEYDIEISDLKELERLKTDPRPTLRRRNSLEMPPDMSSQGSELRLVLLGRSGPWRRAAGNTILGREEFGAQSSQSAVTQRIVRREGEVCGRQLVLVDTPDWFCPRLSLEDTRQDVGLFVRLSAPGPHAFLLVIPVETSKEEDRGLQERMEDMFGEGCWGHTVILFTHDDSLKEQSIEEFLQAGSQDLQQLVEKCGSRYHILNIKEMTHGPQVTELLVKVEDMSGNRERFYSNPTYQEAVTQVREIEGKIQKEREERKQREEREMRERHEKELQEKDVVIEKLNEEITELKETINDLQKQMEEEKDEEMKRELEREIKTQNEVMKNKMKDRKKIEDMKERHKKEIKELTEKYEEDRFLLKVGMEIISPE